MCLSCRCQICQNSCLYKSYKIGVFDMHYIQISALSFYPWSWNWKLGKCDSYPATCMYKHTLSFHTVSKVSNEAKFPFWTNVNKGRRGQNWYKRGTFCNILVNFSMILERAMPHAPFWIRHCLMYLCTNHDLQTETILPNTVLMSCMSI